jgi:hypothetical protein
MYETHNAPVKDLLSTGYFYEELKNHIKSTASEEIDLVSFNRDFAVPYLIKKSASYKAPGQTNRARILNLAVKFLSNVNGGELTKTIFVLKKVAEIEEDVSEREIYTTDLPERTLSCRQRSESAQSLKKLLTSIIKMFRLEQFGKKDKSEEGNDPVEDSIKSYWEMSMLPAV